MNCVVCGKRIKNTQIYNMIQFKEWRKEYIEGLRWGLITKQTSMRPPFFNETSTGFIQIMRLCVEKLGAFARHALCCNFLQGLGQNVK